MPKVCLSFVFNHQFEQNIPKLNTIYKERFSTIRFLSPFSTFSKNKQVIPVYETSVHFQGFLAQSYKHLPKDCDYYIFCGDDLLLNPVLDETNIIEKLNCSNSSYIKYLNPVWKHSFAWHKFEECNNFPNVDCLVPHYKYFPNREQLIKKYESYGLDYKNLGFHNLFGVKNRGLSFERIYAGLKYLFRHKFRRYVHFPLIEGFSDFIVIPKESLCLFCHYCGVFAAMNLWVDAAIASSMVLSSKKIGTEKDHSYKGIEIWDPSDINCRLQKTNFKLNRLSELFEEDEFYIHPVKLSAFS